MGRTRKHICGKDDVWQPVLYVRANAKSQRSRQNYHVWTSLLHNLDSNLLYRVTCALQYDVAWNESVVMFVSIHVYRFTGLTYRREPNYFGIDRSCGERISGTASLSCSPALFHAAASTVSSVISSVWSVWCGLVLCSCNVVSGWRLFVGGLCC